VERNFSVLSELAQSIPQPVIHRICYSDSNSYIALEDVSFVCNSS